MGGVTRPGRIRVRIDRLVLDGASGARGELVAAAITEELTRLAASGAPSNAIPDRVEADLVNAPVAAGRAIAAALHARLLAEASDE